MPRIYNKSVHQETNFQLTEDLLLVLLLLFNIEYSQLLGNKGTLVMDGGAAIRPVLFFNVLHENGQ